MKLFTNYNDIILYRVEYCIQDGLFKKTIKLFKNPAILGYTGPLGVS